MALFYFLIISVALLLGVEFLKRKVKISSNLTRRLAHLGSATIAFFSPLFLNHYVIFVACLIFSVVMFFGRRKHVLSSVYGVERRTYGDVFLPLGEAVIALFFLPNNILAFQYGVLIMGVSDPVAGLVGDYFARYKIKIWKAQKSFEGSLSFFISSVIISCFFFPMLSWPVILICILLTLIEVLSGEGIDNLLLPIAAAIFFRASIIMC